MKSVKLFIFILFPFLLFSQTNFEKAEKLFKDKKLEEAKGLFESYLKSVPNHQKTIEYLGDIAGSSKIFFRSVEIWCNF